MCKGSKKRWITIFPLLFVCIILFSILSPSLNLLFKVNAEGVYTEEYNDPYSDVLYYDEITDTIKSTDKKAHIDIKGCQVGNNNTTLFVRIDFWGNVKNMSGVIYHVFFDTYQFTESGMALSRGPWYENGGSTFQGINNTLYPIVWFCNGSSISFEIPVYALEKEQCIWNGSILRIGIMTEELSDEHYTENLEKKIYYNLTNYREREPYPRAYIRYITPNPAIQDDTVYLSGYGVTSEDAYIIEYEWIVNGELMSNQSSFSIENISTGAYVYFRVKDSNGNWSKQIVETLIMNLSANAPTVEILSPSENEKVKGMVTFSYKAVAKEDRFIEKVEMKIGNGNWFTIFSTTTASGSDYYNYTWDSASVSDGYHPIWLKAYDGKYYSTADAVMVYVDNGNADSNEENSGFLYHLQQHKTLIIPLVIILGILICLIVIKVKIGKRKSRINEERIK